MPIAHDFRPNAKPTAARTRGGIVLGRRTLAGAGAIAALTFAWAGATTWYIASRDELAQRFFARQTEQRYAYEDRITELKGRLEREITRNMVERTGYTARVDGLAVRQREIEARQIWLGGLAARLGGGAALTPDQPAEPVGLAASLPEPPASPASNGKPAPVAEPFSLDLRLPSRDAAGRDEPRDRMSALEGSLGRVSALAWRSADNIRRSAGERATQVRLALEATRLDTRRLPSRPGPMPGTSPAGGPFVPFPNGFDAASFDSLAADTEARVAELEGHRASARALPLRSPLAGELEPTSGFGYRLDPFMRGPALHTGADFRAAAGSPVKATAGGRVISAEPSGGYGNMVEIDHGLGITTRYGHLSAFTVAPGSTVEAGQVVGRAGSTGRSTGAHLHYETRIDGEPVNPARFLAAGRVLAGAETR